MAATSIDLVFSGMRPMETFFKVGATMEAAGILYSTMYLKGRPGPMLPDPTALPLAGESLTTCTGQIPFYNPPAGQNTYLSRFSINAGSAGIAFLCDRLWHNGSISATTTTDQTINSTIWPARCPIYSGGTLANASGHNILVGLEVGTVATTNGSAVLNTTMTYTNSDGITGRLASISSWPQTATFGTFVPFQLASGDKGVQSIQSLTLGTTYGAGNIHLVAYRVLAQVNVPVGYGGGFIDALSGGFPQLYDNTVPFVLWLPSATTAVTLHGGIIYCQC